MSRNKCTRFVPPGTVCQSLRKWFCCCRIQTNKTTYNIYTPRLPLLPLLYGRHANCSYQYTSSCPVPRSIDDSTQEVKVEVFFLFFFFSLDRTKQWQLFSTGCLFQASNTQKLLKNDKNATASCGRLNVVL